MSDTRKLYVRSFGCQMNVYDAQRMTDTLAKEGYVETDSPDDADLVILNTCHIREKAAEKVYSELGRLKKAQEEAGRRQMVAVAGCVAQAEGGEILKRARGVDLVVGPQSYHKLPELLADAARRGHNRRAGIVETEFPVEDKFDFLPTLDAVDMIAWIAAFLTMALGSIPQQDVFQRVNSARNERVAVWGTTLGGASYFFFAAVPLFLAYTAQIIDPGMVERLMEEDSQLILPTLILQYMPFVAQVVFFGALLSVIMSTASGTLLAPSVTFSENVLRGFIPGMNDRQFLWSTRATVVVFTVLVTWYATSTESTIHQMVENAYRVTLAGAFVPLAAGLFWKRANNLGAALAISLGLFTWLLLEFTAPEGDIEPQLFGLLASLVGMIAGAYLGPRTHHRPQAGHHHAAAATHHARR